jgi:hypothetical protein
MISKLWLNDMEKRGKEIENKKGKRIYKTYTFEVTKWFKNDTVIEKVYVTAENKHIALHEAELPFQGIDYQISPGGIPVPYQLGTRNFYRDMHAKADPIIKAEKKAAENIKKADEKSANRSAKIDRARDGLHQVEQNNKLERMHNATKHRI